MPRIGPAVPWGMRFQIFQSSLIGIFKNEAVVGIGKLTTSFPCDWHVTSLDSAVKTERLV